MSARQLWSSQGGCFYQKQKSARGSSLRKLAYTFEGVNEYLKLFCELSRRENMLPRSM